MSNLFFPTSEANEVTELVLPLIDKSYGRQLCLLSSSLQLNEIQVRTPQYRPAIYNMF